MSGEWPDPGVEFDDRAPSGSTGDGDRSPSLGKRRPPGGIERRLNRNAPEVSTISPRMTAVFGALFGVATIASVFALLIQVFPVTPQRDALARASASSPSVDGPDGMAPRTRRGPVRRVRPDVPQPWRVEDLKDTHQILQGEMKRRSLSTVLDEQHVPKDQVYRILKAFDGVFKFDRPKNRDRYVIALERGTRKVIGFEYIVGPTEIHQARTNDQGFLEAKTLDMQVKKEDYATSFYVSKNLARSYEYAGLEPGLTRHLNEAFNGQTSTEAFEEGGVVKVVLVETTALGRFVGYDRVKALEYRPADPSKPALRAYWFEGATVRSYVDDKGRHPSNAGWRSPVPGAPVTSHFNPKRLHPVLKTVMPHNGTDFGAPMGTPVYASFRGTVTFIGNQGPSGNLVLIEHAGGIQTGYAHLSRFAEGVKVGDPVGTRQLVGYVGSTGRSTGPHLHFSAKRNGKFFDALELRLDALQLLPGSERVAFAEQKSAYDAALDALPMPEPPEPEPEPSPAADAGSERGTGGGGAGRMEAEATGTAVPPSGPTDRPSGASDGPTLLGDDLSGDIE